MGASHVWSTKSREPGEEYRYQVWGNWRVLSAQTEFEPSARPEWIEAYRQALDPTAKPLLAMASKGDRLMALLPLLQKRGYFAGWLFRKLVSSKRPFHISFCLPRVAGEQCKYATRGIWEGIKRTLGWEVLEIPIYLGNGACRRIFECVEKDGYHSWTRLLPESPIPDIQMSKNSILD